MQALNQEEKSVVNYQVNKFSSWLLEKDDLEQEAYLIFLKSRETFDENNGTKFKTYFSRLLERHFINLYHREDMKHKGVLSGNIVQTDEIDEESEEDILNLISSGKWTPEDSMLWSSLVEEISGRLDGLALGVFEESVDPSIELYKASRMGRLSLTDFANRFGVSRADIRQALVRVKQSTLIALGKRGLEIRKILAQGAL